MAANTTCSLLSSWTLKKALGCLSIIVPWAGIKSSAANQFLLGAGFRTRHNNTDRTYVLFIHSTRFLNLFKKPLDSLSDQA
jgi:hypothetical protein